MLQRTLYLIAAAALSCACASVPPGHAAIVTWPNAGVDPAPLSSGDTFVGPFAQVAELDLREQEASADFTALLADGAPVSTGSSLVTYRIAPEELASFARESSSPNQDLISPVVQSAVRRVLGGLRLSQLDTAHLRAAQDEITRIAAGELRSLHILLERVELRQVAPAAPALNQAVLDTGVLEQQALRAPSELQLAQSRAAAARAEASGVAAAHAAIGPTLTPGALEEQRNRAWQALLAAPTTRVQVTDSPTRSSK